MESVAFKEWAIVCEALGRGRQSIILRKGGIAEGRGGFSFRYREFFLLPTFFHEQPEKVRKFASRTDSSCGEIDIEFAAGSDDKIDINFFAKLELVKEITCWETMQALEPLHILKPEVVRERFEYDKAQGLQVAFVRVFRVVPSWKFPNQKSYAGCRSWVKLPEPPGELCFGPVLDNAEHSRRRNEFTKITQRPEAVPARG
jgi:hypothetical protein